MQLVRHRRTRPGNWWYISNLVAYGSHFWISKKYQTPGDAKAIFWFNFVLGNHCRYRHWDFYLCAKLYRLLDFDFAARHPALDL